MPTWIANAGEDRFYEGQPAQVAQALGDRATLRNFTGLRGIIVRLERLRRRTGRSLGGWERCSRSLREMEN